VKTLSVLLTLILFLTANLLAARLKDAGVLPADQNPGMERSQDTPAASTYPPTIEH